MPYFSPFIKMWAVVEGVQVDISDSVANLKYKRDMEKENEISFTIEQSYVQQLSETILRRGLTVLFKYGYKGGKQSTLQKARVVELKYKYNGAGKVSLTVKGRDLGSVMKKSYSNKIWKGVTTSDIAKEIATRYNLDFVGDDTEYVWNSYPQSQKDDYAFLLEIVEKDESGNYRVYIDNGRLVLERRGLDKSSSLSFQFGEGNRIIDFTVSEEEKTTGMTGAAGTTLTGFDPDAKEKIEATAAEGTEKEGISLGKFDYKFSANGELLSSPLTETAGNVVSGVSGIISGNGVGNDGSVGNLLQGGSGDPSSSETLFGDKRLSNAKSGEELVNEANYGLKSGKLKIAKAKLKVNGEPNLKLNSIVTIRGVLPLHEGNYLIKSIEDDVSSGGYTTTLDMNKNAAARGKLGAVSTANTNPSTVNETVGPDIVEAVEEVFSFDANGNLLTPPKKDYKVD